MKYCTVTPTRSDRPALLKFCMQQLKVLNGGFHVTNAHIVNYLPIDDRVDLVDRVKHGVALAKQEGYEYVFIIEDDDYYPEDYFSNFTMDGSIDFFGWSDTIYYNLKNKTYAKFLHKDRASLFCTGFKISALDDFAWPPSHTVFLDIALWAYATRRKKKISLKSGNPCLGIKHNIGKTGGKAHRWVMKNADPDYEFLKSQVSEKALEFYKTLQL